MKERIEKLLAEGRILSASVVLVNASTTSSSSELTESEFKYLNKRIKILFLLKKKKVGDFPTSRGKSNGHMLYGHGHR